MCLAGISQFIECVVENIVVCADIVFHKVNPVS